MNRGRELRKLYRVLSYVKRYQEQMKQLSNEALSKLTVEFQKRINEGESLDKILPEAFAAMCEANARILKKYPYDVQILCGIALHYGYLCEMNTGEGKTLTATLPLYLNALTKKSTILVTANEYLALRDSEELRPVFEFMGLHVAAGVRRGKENPYTNQEKQKIYQADIVYTTHGILGFDYLLNHLVTRAQDRFMRDLYYVIIDEADSVLLDGAQMPLVISGSPRVQSNLYELADFFVTTLIKGKEYETEEKKVWLTKEGIRYAEQFFSIDNFYGAEHFEINRHVILALRAHVLFEKSRDYMVNDAKELNLLDSGSGRMLHGVKLRGGQHQALEAKEKIEVSQETRSIASITYQNLFLQFEKMAGMSGTIAEARDELMDVYAKKVIKIPPNHPVQRIDYPDLYFENGELQRERAIEETLKLHKTGQPVLLVVSTIAQTEQVSRVLLKNSIPHNVLNANNAFWEAEIIKEAGQLDAVTVATSMAGRGTDIKISKEVKALGGLAVIGIGRMNNSRLERQARGRAGRQGDPGSSRFYVSLEDEVVLDNCAPKVIKVIEKKKHIQHRKLRPLIDGAQQLNEEYAVLSRKQAVNYDQVVKRQRALMYETRDHLLDGQVINEELFLELAKENIARFVANEKKFTSMMIHRYLLDHISYHLDEEVAHLDLKQKKCIRAYLQKKVKESFEEQKTKLKDSGRMDEFMRKAALYAIDNAWVEQVDFLSQLQSAVVGRSTAQRNPVYEYQKEALRSFLQMQETIKTNIMRNILLGSVTIDEKKQLFIQLP